MMASRATYTACSRCLASQDSGTVATFFGDSRAPFRGQRFDPRALAPKPIRVSLRGVFGAGKWHLRKTCTLLVYTQTPPAKKGSWVEPHVARKLPCARKIGIHRERPTI